MRDTLAKFYKVDFKWFSLAMYSSDLASRERKKFGSNDEANNFVAKDKLLDEKEC